MLDRLHLGIDAREGRHRLTMLPSGLEGGVGVAQGRARDVTGCRRYGIAARVVDPRLPCRAGNASPDRAGGAAAGAGPGAGHPAPTAGSLVAAAQERR